MPSSPPAPLLPLPPLVAALAARGKEQAYRKNWLLIQEGDIGDTIYVVLRGRVKVFATNADGTKDFTLGTYGRGEYVGEMGLDGGPRSASVITIEPTTCAIIPRPTLEAFMRDRPEFAFELITKLIRRTRAATFSAKQLALNDVYGRLKAWLEENARWVDGRRRVEPRPTYADLAGQLGCTRRMAIKVLQDLRTGDYIADLDDGFEIARPLPVRW
jgi:CRP/FNR family transcriptional regulator, cyclic AMP receptor protein